MNTLFIGYGNPDRQDDGVAWHILAGIANQLGLVTSPSWEDPLPSTPEADLAFYLQLTPEIAEDLTAYDRVCFVDAHTGKIPQNVQMVDITPEYQTSPFTHHLTPEMLQREIDKMPADLPIWIYHIKPQVFEETAGELANIDPTRVHVLEQGKTYSL